MQNKLQICTLTDAVRVLVGSAGRLRIAPLTPRVEHAHPQRGRPSGKAQNNTEKEDILRQKTTDRRKLE